MKAEIKKVGIEDDPISPLVIAIVLDVEEDYFQAVWDCLEKSRI